MRIAHHEAVRNGLDEGREVCDRKGLVDKRGEDKRDGDKRGGVKEVGHERLTRLI
jgi:hypothetical protein